MIGSSMGGYAAIRAGLALNARAVLAFSPQVYLGEERASLVGGAMPWLDPYLLKLQLAAQLEPDSVRLANLLESVEAVAGSSSTIVQIHVGTLDGDTGHELEMLRSCAARSQSNAMPGLGIKGSTGVKISIRPHAHDDPVGAMKASGELQELLKGLCSNKKATTPKKKAQA